MKPTILRTIDRACPKWTAFKVCGSIVIATPTGEEVLTISRTAIGTAYAHDVTEDERFLGVCIALSNAEIPFDTFLACVKEDQT